jgi:acylphosphatase
VEALVALISGRVQGVGFRWFTEKEARARDVRGYVRNLPDGRVEVLAQGDAPALAMFCERLREGPRASRVEDIETFDIEVDPELSSFTVRF